jgi:biopolymer transport protein ExbB
VINKRFCCKPIKSALLKYQEVKREGLDSEAAAETIHKEIEEVTQKCQC